MVSRIRWLRRPVATLPLLVVSACATHFVCPAHGGREWREVRSPHFVVATDLSSAAARRLAQDLEAMRSVITTVLPASDGVPDEIVHVVGFASQREYEDFASPRTDGYYALDAFGVPTVVPRWASEGLATYLETIGNAGREKGFAEAGAVSPRRLHTVLGTTGPKVEHGPGGASGSTPSVRLALGRDARFTTPEAYAESWGLVFFLVNRHGDRFQQLLRRFKAGEDGRAAWLAVFPEWDLDSAGALTALDTAIRTFLRGGTFQPTMIELPKEVVTTTERALPSGAVHDLTLLLRARRKRTVDEPLLAEVAEALEEDPANVSSAAVLADAEDARAPALARAATVAHPEDFRAWMLLSKLLPREDTGGREQVLLRAVATGGATHSAYNSLAWLLYKQHRSTDALGLAREAVARAPWNAHALDTLAAVLGDLHQCDEAVAYERRAVDALHEDSSETLRAELEQRLRELEDCVAASRAASGAS